MQKRIVICGSMSTYKEMIKIKKYLKRFCIEAIIPEDDSSLTEQLFKQKNTRDEYKRKLSKMHMTKIRDPKTQSILIINSDKYGIKNYIGANSFAEIAIAFIQNKRIFLLYDFPDMYYDELSAWKVIPLKGDIDILVRRFKTNKSSQYMLPGIINSNE